MSINKLNLDLKKNMSLGTIISWVTVAVNIIIAIFLTPFLINNVGKREYGLNSFAVSFLNWLTIFTTIFGSSCNQFITREQANHGTFGEKRALAVFQKIFFMLSLAILLLGLLLSALVFFKIIPLPEYSSKEIDIISLIMILSLLTSALNALLTVYKGYFFYKQKYIFIYSLNLIIIILKTTLSFVLVQKGFGIIGVAISNFVFEFLSSLIQFLVSKFLLHAQMSLRPSNQEDVLYRKTLLKEIFIFTFFVITNVLVDNLHKNLDIIILGFFNPNDVANYHIASTFMFYLIQIVTIISVVFFQKGNHIYFIEKNEAKLDVLYKKASLIELFLTFLIIGGFIFTGKYFIGAWLGPDSTQIYYITCSLFLIVSYVNSNDFSNYIRRMKGQHKRAAFIYLFVFFTNLCVSLILGFLLPKHEVIYGCLIGTSISTILGQWILLSIYDYKFVRINTKFFAKSYVLFFLVTSLLLFFLNRVLLLANVATINIWLQFFLRGFIYVVFYMILGTITYKYLLNK